MKLMPQVFISKNNKTPNSLHVSVVIPVYNGAKTLAGCLESALKQNYNDYELIVADNNSTDGTKKIIKDFGNKDKRVKYVFEPERGRGSARNAGVKKASGEIIVMTDSDCIVPESWIKEITEPIRSGKTEIVQGNEDDLIGNYWTKMQQEFNRKFLKSHAHGNCYIDHVDTKNFAIKKEVLRSVGLFNESLKNFEDFELNIRLRKRGEKIYFLESSKVKHYHKDTFWSLFKRRIDQGYWTTKIYYMYRDFFKENPDEMTKSLTPSNFFMFFPGIIRYSLHNGISYGFFHFITGVAWRIGIVYALIGGTR